MDDMEDSENIARYLAEHTQLPLDDVIEIYRAGAPWPMLFKDLDRMAEQDAHAAAVPVDTAAKALDQLCDLEGAHMKALVEQAQHAVARAGLTVPSFDMPEVQAVADHPTIRDLLHYSERVALRVGEAESWKVFAIYLALLQYAWEYPDWGG
jgi:hypothetical protein